VLSRSRATYFSFARALRAQERARTPQAARRASARMARVKEK